MPKSRISRSGRASCRAAPNGIPGVAARLPILVSAVAFEGRISLQDVVALASTKHAWMYDL